MSESDVVPPDKRGDVWFDDGNIVLIANDEDDGAVAFKIHRGILARHSEVFSSMFEVAEPTEDIEQCPVVHMYDAPLELGCLIKALYDGVSLSLQNKSIQDFFYVAGILRLSTKYCIAHLRLQAIQHLAETWSHTLSGHDRMLELALSSEEVDGLSYPFVHPLHVLTLARTNDVNIIVPSALYFLSLYPLADILRGDHPKLQVEHPSRPESSLTSQDLQDYTLIFQWRIQLLIDFTREKCCRTPTCRTNTQCKKAFNRLSNILSRQWIPRTGPFHFMVQGVEQLANDSDACAECRLAFRRDIQTFREAAWKEMPSVIGLPSWEAMKETDLALPPPPPPPPKARASRRGTKPMGAQHSAGGKNPG